MGDIHPDIQKPPEWADDRHIGKDGEHTCARCWRERNEPVELEVEETKMLAGWMGVNWKDGFEEIVRCPECDKRGQITTKRMKTAGEDFRFSRLGAAAHPRLE